MTIKNANLFITGANLQSAPSIFKHSYNQDLLARVQKSLSAQNAILHNIPSTDLEPSEFVFVEKTTPEPESTHSFVYIGNLKSEQGPTVLSEQKPIVAQQQEITTTRTQEKECLSFETHKTKPNEGGGNCLFYSVIDSLDLDLTHIELRTMTYEYAKQNAKDTHFQQLLINDASEIAADMSYICQSCIDTIQKGVIPESILDVIYVRKNFSLYPLLETFPDFFKPFDENFKLIEEINQLFATNNPITRNSPQALKEKNALLTAKKNEIIDLLHRIDKRWTKIASMSFSEAHLPKIKTEIVDCMIHDMQKIGAFGGQAALYSLSQLLQCSIYIFGKNPRKNSFQETKKFLSSTKKIHLLLNYNHFEAILENSQIHRNQQIASNAIKKTLDILSQTPIADLASDILAHIPITKEEAIDLLTNATMLNPSNNADKRKLQLIKNLTDILGN